MRLKFIKLPLSANQGLLAMLLVVFSVSAFSQTTYTFNYTGSTQTIVLPAGNYSIECWGANGGDATNATAPMFGGRGGYSAGFFTNPTTATFNVYVGGRGGNTTAANTGAGGGGMSDVAPATNTTIIIIAAGGGGGATSGSSSEASTGGDGGGLTGGTALDGTGVSTGTAASGGSQTAGGIALAGSYGAGTPGGYGYGGGAANGGSDGFMHGPGGAGGNGGVGGWNGGGGGCTTTGGNDHAAGGGAGYYGGGGGRGDGGAGGGGSGYIGGLTSGTTTMFGQSDYVPNPDLSGNGRIHITELCSVTLSVTGLNAIGELCPGNTLTITTDAVSNYSWTTGSTAPFILVSPTSNTVYGLTATSPSNCTSSSQVVINVSPTPPVTITNNNPVICLGNQAVLSASGGDTFLWSTSSTAPNITVVPAQSTIYSVTSTYTLSNCISTQTATVDVVTLTLAISGVNNICKGETTTLTANSTGATAYNWNPGLPIQAISVSPTTNAIYVATAQILTLNISCVASSSILVTVRPVPNILAVASKISMCEGEALDLAASGGTAYTWSWGSQTTTGSAIVITPTVSSNLVVNVTGTGANGCTNAASLAISVNACTGIGESAFSADFQAFPNPSQGELRVSAGTATELQLFSTTGQVIRTINLSELNDYQATITGLDSGIYIIAGQAGSQAIYKKVVVDK